LRVTVARRRTAGRHRSRRPLRRALGTSLATAAVLALTAAPAWARDDGEVPGDKMSAIETVLVYVVTPAALFVLIALLVMAPSMRRGPRYRPGVGWWAAPIWFNGPAAVDNLDAVVRSAVPTPDAGGASARW